MVAIACLVNTTSVACVGRNIEHLVGHKISKSVRHIIKTRSRLFVILRADEIVGELKTEGCKMTLEDALQLNNKQVTNPP